MARIAGVEIPNEKRVVISLTYIYGIGPSRAAKILKDANITQLDKANELNIRSLSTVNQKINNKSDFTVKEAMGLRNLILKKTLKKYSIEELFSEEDDNTIININKEKE